MKLLNILGAVIAAHVAVLVLAVAIPGCRSTRTTAPAADDNTATYTPAPARSSTPAFSAAPELSDRDLNPPLAGSEPPIFDPNAPAVAAGGNTRFSPTRPDSTVASAINAPVTTMAPVTPATTYTVQRGDNLWSLAKSNGISVRELANANNIAADSMLRLGQVLVIPGKEPEPEIATSMATAEVPMKTYTIQPGDTLGRIARVHGVTVSQLKAFNNLRSDMVRAGDTLSIPETTSSAAVTTTPAAAQSTTATPAATAPAGAYKHVVAPGESLTVIARRYGVKVGEVALANKIRDPSLIRPGQELIIPGWNATDAPAPARTVQPIPSAASTPASSASVPANEDLDAGLDDSLDNVPVIDVERAGETDAEDDSAVPTISIGGGSSGGGSDEPPLFN